LLVGDTFVFATGSGELFAISIGTGALLWTKTPRDLVGAEGTLPRPLVDAMARGSDGSLWVGTQRVVPWQQSPRLPASQPTIQAVLTVLDVATGTQRWQHLEMEAIILRIILDVSAGAFLRRDGGDADVAAPAGTRCHQ
jgi:outer membrane protein assembly factor BamB